MTQLIVKIGPLTESSGRPGKSAYFLVPGDPDNPMVFADNLAEARPSLEAIRTDRLVCEPALADEASRLGIPAGEWDDDSRAMLGLLALDIALRDSFAAIERDSLIFHFCRAAAAFAARDPAAWPEPGRLLRAEIAGAPAPRTLAVLAGPGIALLDRAADPLRSLADADGLGAVLAPGPPEVVDALARAHGLAAVPEPFRLANGAKHPVSDAELALLTAALFATAHLAPDAGAEAQGHVAVDDCEARVIVARPR